MISIIIALDTIKSKEEGVKDSDSTELDSGDS